MIKHFPMKTSSSNLMWKLLWRLFDSTACCFLVFSILLLVLFQIYKKLCLECGTSVPVTAHTGQRQHNLGHPNSARRKRLLQEELWEQQQPWNTLFQPPFSSSQPPLQLPGSNPAMPLESNFQSFAQEGTRVLICLSREKGFCVWLGFVFLKK